MAGFWAGWRAVWATRTISVPSPLPVAAAVQRLAVPRFGGGFSPVRSEPYGPPTVAGHVSEHRVHLSVHRRGRRRGQAWRPVLRGRLVARSTGCELVGSFASPVIGRIFTVGWLALAALFGVVAIVMTVEEAGSGAWSSAWGSLAVAGVAVAMAASAVGLVGLTGQAGQRDEEFLRAWLVGHLDRADQPSGPAG